MQGGVEINSNLGIIIAVFGGVLTTIIAAGITAGTRVLIDLLVRQGQLKLKVDQQDKDLNNCYKMIRTTQIQQEKKNEELDRTLHEQISRSENSRDRRGA